MVETRRKLDATDRDILKRLSGDGRMTFEELGRAVGLSRPAVHERVKRLVADGVVRRFGAVLDWEAVGLGVPAVLWVRTAGTSCAEAARAIAGLGTDEVRIEECHRVAGDWSLLVKLRTASLPALLAFGDHVRAQAGVVAVTTTVVMETICEDAELRGSAAP
jgi:Lrp/AsnC family leucine-responsive transcriptional regulator